MPTLKERATAFLDRARARSRLLDHAVRTQQHYSTVKGSLQAAAVTYFAFLSFFPILALAFFVVGYLARVYPEARDDLLSALETVLPGLIGPDPDQISLATIQDSAGTVGLIGLVGLLYSGLGWLSGMREALGNVFQGPPSLAPSFVVGKLRDLMTLAVIGVTLVVSVAVSGLVSGFSADFLELIGLGRDLTWLLAIIGVVVGGAADMLLFFALFKLLAKPRLSARALWSGALIGAIAAEALKWLSSYLIGATKDQPAFQAFGIALILLVWINYFSRVVVYAAAWAAVLRPREAESADQLHGSAAEEVHHLPEGERTERQSPRPTRPEVSSGVWFGSGAALVLAVVALLRRRRKN